MPDDNGDARQLRLDAIMGGASDHEAEEMDATPGDLRRRAADAPPPAFDVTTEDVRVRLQLSIMLGQSSDTERLLDAVRTRAVEVANAWVRRHDGCSFPPLAPSWILQHLAGARVDALGDEPAPVEPKSVFDGLAADLDEALNEASTAARRQLAVRTGELITACAVRSAAQQAHDAIRSADGYEARRVFDAFDAALTGLHFDARHCLDATALARAGVKHDRHGATVGRSADTRTAA